MKIISIVNMKGGVGKSTVALLCALNLCKNCKVAILDMDLQGSLSSLSNTIEDIYITTDKSILDREEDFDILFIDNPPYHTSELLNLIKRSDLIIIPTKAGILDLLALQGTMQLIKEAKKIANSLIVFNMVKPNTTLTAEIRARVRTFDVKLANTHLSDLVSVIRAVVTQKLDNNKAQRQLDSLTKEILTALL